MGDEYARELSKQAVARACLALGVKSTPLAVINCVADGNLI